MCWTNSNCLAEVGRQADEVQPGSVSAALLGWAVAATAAQQTVQVTDVEGSSGPGGQRVARVGPADVGADRAGQAERVTMVGEVVIVGQGGDVLVWRVDQRGAAGPAAYYLGRQGGPLIWVL